MFLKIKENIPIWLSNKIFYDFIKDQFFDEEDLNQDEKQKILNDLIQELNLDRNTKFQDLLKVVFSIFQDSSIWIEEFNFLLEEEWTTYFSGSKFEFNDSSKSFEYHKCAEFISDVGGDYNKELVEYYYNNPNLAAKCINRTLVPNNFLGDNFRLEVILDPEDKEIIGWVVIVD